jgi:hypothetical protein
MVCDPLGTIRLFFSWLPIGLWAFGVIESYTPALVISLGSGLISFVGSFIWLRQQVSGISSRGKLHNDQ